MRDDKGMFSPPVCILSKLSGESSQNVHVVKLEGCIDVTIEKFSKHNHLTFFG